MFSATNKSVVLSAPFNMNKSIPQILQIFTYTVQKIRHL